MEDDNTITAYKGFDQKWQCRGFQFEIGKTYQHQGVVQACRSGFHSCENPLDVFQYYSPAHSRYAVVRASGSMDSHFNDSKVASECITVVAELSPQEMFNHAVDWVKSRTAPTGQSWPRSSTSSMEYSLAVNTEEQSAAFNTGNHSVVTNEGIQSAAINTGRCSMAKNYGTSSVAASTGAHSLTINNGRFSSATNTGDYSLTISAGIMSAAVNTGFYAEADSTGDSSAAVSVGFQSSSKAEGSGSVAVALGERGRARAAAGGAIVLCRRNSRPDGSITHIRSSLVGENGIKPDTWYTLDQQGEFVELAEDCRNW